MQPQGDVEESPPPSCPHLQLLAEQRHLSMQLHHLRLVPPCTAQLRLHHSRTAADSHTLMLLLPLVRRASAHRSPIAGTPPRSRSRWAMYCLQYFPQLLHLTLQRSVLIAERSGGLWVKSSGGNPTYHESETVRVRPVGPGPPAATL